MNRKRWGLTLLSILVSGALVIQLLGCGYLLHPERRGQRGGSIDPGIAVLDGVGLLFFIIPGLIAFAVDFTSGTIYYPGGRKSASSTMSDIGIVQLDPKELDEETICQKVQEYTGCPRNFTLQEAEMLALTRREEIGTNFEKALRSGFQVDWLNW